MELVHARARRRFQRGLKRKPMALIKKLRKAKKEAPPNEKPAVVKTHLRDMLVVPEMIGSVIGVRGSVAMPGPGLDLIRYTDLQRQDLQRGSYLSRWSCVAKADVPLQVEIKPEACPHLTACAETQGLTMARRWSATTSPNSPSPTSPVRRHACEVMVFS